MLTFINFVSKYITLDSFFVEHSILEDIFIIYSALINKYMVRQLIKPGITGAAQVKGYRGETKKLKDMEGRVRLDVWYIENWSLSLDINIIFQTVWNAFKGDENAY